MSIFVKILDCPTHPVKLPEILKMVSVTDDDGSVYLNLKFNEKEQCDDYERAFSCGQNIPLKDMIKTVVVEDDCGRPALNILANICDVCGFGEASPPL